MNKEIFKKEFWKQRIDGAVKQHYSVYITHEDDWKKINAAHQSIIKAHVRGKVLDAGCGYGRLSELFTKYTGVDFSEDFIREAKKNYPDKTFLQGDLRKLTMFEDKEFNWAIVVSIKKMVIDNKGEKPWLKMQDELTRVAKHVLILEYEEPWNYEIL